MDLSIQFLAGGELTAEMDSPFVDMTVKPGQWNVRPAAGSNRGRTRNSASESRSYIVTYHTVYSTKAFVDKH